MTRFTEVASLLERAGFGVVQVEPHLPGVAESARPDLLAWASNREGELVPWAAVEITSRRAETALPVLARTQALTGTREHYVLSSGEWFKADAGLRTLDRVDGPSSPPLGGSGRLVDVPLATSLLRERLWRRMDEERGRGTSVAEVFADLVAEFYERGANATSGGQLRLGREVLWQAARRALVDFSRDVRSGIYASHPVVASAVSALAGSRLDGTVLDPFCGTGSFIWAAAERAAHRGSNVDLIGFDISAAMVNVVEGLLVLAPVSGVVTCADAFRTRLPEADVVLAAPPMGLRLPFEHELLTGSVTRDGDVAAVDLAVRALRPGGRAVLQVSPGFTFRANGEQYRQFLTDRYRVAALIGCPTGSVPGAAIGSVLVVIDATSPGRTFVAQLGEDWQTQLSEGGAGLQAALAHIDAPAVEAEG